MSATSFCVRLARKPLQLPGLEPFEELDRAGGSEADPRLFDRSGDPPDEVYTLAAVLLHDGAVEVQPLPSERDEELGLVREAVEQVDDGGVVGVAGSGLDVVIEHRPQRVTDVLVRRPPVPVGHGDGDAVLRHPVGHRAAPELAADELRLVGRHVLEPGPPRRESCRAGPRLVGPERDAPVRDTTLVVRGVDRVGQPRLERAFGAGDGPEPLVERALVVALDDDAVAVAGRRPYERGDRPVPGHALQSQQDVGPTPPIGPVDTGDADQERHPAAVSKRTLLIGVVGVADRRRALGGSLLWRAGLLQSGRPRVVCRNVAAPLCGHHDRRRKRSGAADGPIGQTRPSLACLTPRRYRTTLRVNGVNSRSEWASGGRHWARTSDLLHVKQVL